MRRGEVVKTVRGIPKKDPIIIVHPVNDPNRIPVEFPVPEREKVSVPVRKKEKSN